MKPSIWKRFAMISCMLIFLFVLVPVAFAFDERGGDTVVIGENEVIADDLYGGATTFTVNGTIQGDLVVGAQTVVINGTVEGDLIAFAQSVTINGTVGDDVRVGTGALVLGKDAKIGDDLLAGAYSLETMSGSTVGGGVLFGGYQALLGGDVAQDVMAGANGLSIHGKVGGDLKAEVGTPEGAMPYNPFTGTPEMPSIPTVSGGLTFGPEAEVSGNVEYTSSREYDLNLNQVLGKVQHTFPPVTSETTTPVVQQNPIVTRLLENVQRLITLVLLSLLVAWLIPVWFQRLGGELVAKPLPSLGWGTVMYFGFPIVATILFGVAILLGLGFALVRLGGLGGAIVWLALGVIFAGFVLFVLLLLYLSKLVVGYAVGKWILNKLSPSAAEKVIWPLLLGVLLIVILIALPYIGWLFNFVLTLFGLGALWLLIQNLRQPVLPTGIADQSV
ncbi:MAG: polymer-forming cytoskeletal protein [Anaerolineales bacterium]|nr:polymer-forming cytoskeletal protein [Anaerolineales bacterium]